MKKMKVGFVGAGGIANVHLKNIDNHPEAKVVAICDISADIVQEKSKRYGANGYTSVDEMLEKEQLDAVFICVPPFAHGDLEEKIAEKGIHLFVEKPVELDLASARRKLDAIQKAGIINASGYCLRYWDTVQKAREFLQDKEIALVRGYYLSGFVQTPWYRVKSKSGGQLVEQATHVLDLIRYLGGEIRDVSAEMSLQVSGDIEGIDIPDVTSVNIRFESGAVGHLDNTFTQTDHRMGLEIMGRNFRVELAGNSLKMIEKNQVIHDEAKVNFYEVQDAAFIQAILEQDQSAILASYEDGVKTLAVSLAANESDATGTKINVQNYFQIGGEMDVKGH